MFSSQARGRTFPNFFGPPYVDHIILLSKVAQLNLPLLVIINCICSFCLEV